MICIENIGSYIPRDRHSNYDRKDQFGIDDRFITEKLGVQAVARKSADEETSDLCVKAFQALSAKTHVSLEEIDCLVVCTQNPDGHGIPHTAAVVHGALGITENCACFDISLGCSGYVYSLSVVSAFMEANAMRRGLLFTADPYSKTVDPNDKNTALLFGDAASVTLLENVSDAGGRWSPRDFTFATRGQEHAALHNRGENLEMNGRAVFNFALKEVPLQVEKLLAKTGLDQEAIDLFLLHQASKYMVDQLCVRMSLPVDKVPVALAPYGNTVSSSIPLLLEDCLERKELRHIVLSGFGVGLSWASCLLNRQD